MRKVIFSQLFFYNVLFIGIAIWTLSPPSIAFYGTLPFLLVLAIIDFIKVVSCINRQRVNSTARLISCLALIAIGFVIIVVGVSLWEALLFRSLKD
jgi:hypothetical protein